MKNLIFIILLLVLSVTININRLEGQWVQTGPYSGSYSASTTYVDRLYLSVIENYQKIKILKSTDDGVNWNKISEWYFSGFDIISLKATDTYLFKGTSDGIIQRTSNEGLNWEYISSGIPLGNHSIRNIEVCNGLLFTGIDLKGIFRSMNNGTNWVNVNNSLTENSTILSFVFNGNYIFGVNKDHNIFRGNDSGENWINVFNDTAVSFKNITNIGSDLFASTESNGILRSTDNGNNWEFVNNGLSNLSVSSVRSNGSNLFASTIGGGVYMYSNSGANWIAVNNGLQNLKVNDLFFSNTKMFAGTGISGIFYSNDNGSNWQNTNAKLVPLSLYSMNSNDSFLFTGVPGGIFRSSDNGNAWTYSDNGIPQNTYGMEFTTKDSFVFCGSQTNGIFRSSDNGINWIAKNSGLNSSIRASSMASNKDYVFAGFNPGKFYRSTNNGDDWTFPANNGLTVGDVQNIVATDSKLFIGTSTGVFYSTDNGDNWRNTGLNSFVLDLTFNGSFIFALVNGPWPHYSRIYRSSDNGLNWITVYDAEPEHWLRSITSTGNNIFTGGQDNILYSSNNGINWETINSGFPPIQPLVEFLHVSGNYIFAGNTYYSSWKRQLSEIIPIIYNDIGITEIIEPVPDSIYLVDCINSKTVIPQVKIKNYGTINQSNFFDVHFEIKLGNDIVYSFTKQDTISSGQTHTVSFDPHIIAFDFSTYNNDLRTYSVKSWTSLLSDSNHTNDIMSTEYTVNNPNYGYSDIIGYYFLNSSANAACIPEQPVFNWEDTTGSVNLISDGVENVPLSSGNLNDGYFILEDILPLYRSFRFDFVCYDKFVLSTNGVIGLGESIAGLSNPNPQNIPNDIITGPSIFPLWYDLDFSVSSVTGRNLKYKISDEKLIFTFDRVPSYGAVNSNDYVSFQVILDLNIICGPPWQNGNITVQYDNTKSGSTFLDKYNNNTLDAHTVGIQNLLGVGSIQYRYRNSDGEIITPGPLFSSPLALSFGGENSVLPVELSLFTSSVNENNVTLNWQTTGETNNSGFDIERSGSDDKWSKTGFVNGTGNSGEPIAYSFTDKNLSPGKYKYRLKQIDFNGNFEYFNLEGEVNIGVPDKFELSQNYPNPFNPVTNLEFGISELRFVSLKVYDVLGKEVKTLINEIKQAGYYKVQFDGSSFASGVYFYELRSGSFITQKRMLLLK